MRENESRKNEIREIPGTACGRGLQNKASLSFSSSKVSQKADGDGDDDASPPA